MQRTLDPKDIYVDTQRNMSLKYIQTVDIVYKLEKKTIKLQIVRMFKIKFYYYQLQETKIHGCLTFIVNKKVIKFIKAANLRI